MSIDSLSPASHTEEKILVDSLAEHLLQPSGFIEENQRSYSIREAERLLWENEVKDTLERERLSSAIRTAKLLLDREIS